MTGRITMILSSRSGLARRISGVSLMAAGFVLNMVSQGWLLMRGGVGAPLTPGMRLFVSLSFLMLPAGGYLFWRGRQYAAKTDTERILTDTKPHVLYLRAFRTDQSTLQYLLMSLGTMFTEVEQLTDVVRPFGELVALARPGERLPEPGAARIYAADEDWKEVVKQQMQAARLVIIRADVGENLLWELKQAVQTLNPERVLILVLSMKPGDYESFCAIVKPLLGVSLPERETLRRRFGQVSGFIAFSADWKSILLTLRAPYFRRGAFSGSSRAFFKLALRPVFERFGLKWQPPPVRVGEVTVVTMMALIGVLNFIIPTLQLVWEVIHRFVFASR